MCTYTLENIYIRVSPNVIGKMVIEYNILHQHLWALLTSCGVLQQFVAPKKTWLTCKALDIQVYLLQQTRLIWCKSLKCHGYTYLFSLRIVSDKLLKILKITQFTLMSSVNLCMKNKNRIIIVYNSFICNVLVYRII